MAVWQHEETRRRLAEYQADPSIAIPWEKVEAELKAEENPDDGNSITLLPAAQLEIREAAKWYRSRRPSLGTRFRLAASNA